MTVVCHLHISGWTTYVIHPGIFYRKLYNGGNCSTIWQSKTHFYTILTTNLYEATPKYPTDLYNNIYIDNIQKAVVICLIIPTIFPFDTISSIKNTRMYDVRCPPCDKIVDVWRTLSTLWWDCRCMTYVVHPVIRL